MPLYVCHRGGTDRVYRFPDDVANGGTPSGTDVTVWNLPSNISNPDAIVVYEGEILVTDATGAEVAFFAESTQGGTTPTLTRLIDLVSGLTTPSGIAINSDGMWVGDDGGEEVFLLPTSNASETTNADGTVIVTLADTDIIKRFDLHSDVDNIEGLTIVGNTLAVADRTNNRIWYVPLSTANNATSTIVREIVLPPAIGLPIGIAAGMNGNLFVVDRADDDIYLIPSTKTNETTGADGRIIVTLLNSDIIRQFNLPSGLTEPYGLAFKSNQATLTLSTTDTDIIAGESVDFTITSDIDISDFDASDIIVVNGSKVPPLVKNSNTSYTATITAGSVGTMTLSIAENAVTPGNHAVSADFTVNAVPLVATTLELVSGNNQSAEVSTALDNPLVVRVLDQNGDALSGATVTFSTTGGTLSNTSVTTGSNGRASTSLTLPSGTGMYTVTASVTGLTDITFTATAIAPLMLAWQVPSGTVDGTFPVTLTSNFAITGVALGDFVLRREDGVFTQLNANNAVLTNVSGTHNWRIDFTLTGALNHDFLVRLRPNRVQYNRSSYPSSSLDSDTFHVDTRIIATTLEIVSGNNQSAQVSTALANPLIVQVEDQVGEPFDGATVTFSTTGGVLSETSVTTGADGQASTTLTLPASTGTYTVTASVSGLTDVMFTATATAQPLVATTVVVVSGDNQSADANTALSDDLVVQVNDQNGDALGGIDVAFTVSPTDASVTPVSATTGANGQVSTQLTLGAVNGTYTVTATVTGLTPATFTATALAVATTLTIVSGDGQSAEVSTALPNPVVVRVDDQNGDALSGVAIAFSINPTDGALGTPSAITDANGLAQTTVQVGATVGNYTITASGTGLTAVMFTALAVMGQTPVTPVAPVEQQELTEGNLFSINAAGEVEDKGFVWFTERAYNVFGSRLLVVGDDLHIMSGYGDPDALLKAESLASRADNFVHLVLGETLKYILPTFEPDSSIHAELSTLAKNVNAVVSFAQGIIQITDRLPFRALTNGQTGVGVANIAYDSQNKPFPASGYILVGSEVISYSGLVTGAFTGIGRGVLGTEIVNHFNDQPILYLDNVITSTYLSLNLQSDTNRIYNIVRDSNLTTEVRDEASIALYGERPYVLDLSGIGRHENQWILSVFNEYLTELKNLQSIVNLQLTRDTELSLGQIIPFIKDGVVRAMRIVSLRDEQARTTIRGRTISV